MGSPQFGGKLSHTAARRLRPTQPATERLIRPHRVWTEGEIALGPMESASGGPGTYRSACPFTCLASFTPSRRDLPHLLVQHRHDTGVAVLREPRDGVADGAPHDPLLLFREPGHQPARDRPRELGVAALVGADAL